MGKIPRISDAEWQVMRVLWDRAPRTANEVVEALEGSVDWSPPTIKTMLNRLVKKGALAFEQEGRQYWYRPAVDEDACIRAESTSFLRRVYGGAVTPMLAHFLENEKLTANEIAELRRILDKNSGTVPSEASPRAETGLSLNLPRKKGNRQ